MPVDKQRNNVHPVSLSSRTSKRENNLIDISRFTKHGTIRSWPAAELQHLTNPAGIVSLTVSCETVHPRDLHKYER